MLNRIDIMGRLTRDPEYRTTGSGVSVVNFTVAVDRDFSKKDGGEKQTDFIDCVAWRSTAEFVTKYFFKGSMAVVSGRLQIRVWEDDKGNKRRTAEVVAENVYFGAAKKDAGSPPAVSVQDGDAGYCAFSDSLAYAQEKLPENFQILDATDEQLPF